jgi:hypothetical protein
MTTGNLSTNLYDGDAPQTVAALSDSMNGATDAQAADIRETEARETDMLSPAMKPPRAQREAGDQVNRFLFCALVSESAKLIKASATGAGESLPMAMIVRGVLRSYRLAAKDEYGALAEPEFDMAGLRRLNKKILRDEIARHSQDIVKTSEARLARAKQLGDDTRILAEKDALERAIELRDRLAEKFS